MFTRKKITIPSAGQNEVFFLRGVSIVVESMSTYTGPNQVPLLSFGDGSGSPQPLYPQSVYVSEDGFQRVAITGTAESAGDEVFLLATDACLNEEININSSAQKRATVESSFVQAMDDTVYSIPEIDIVSSQNENPSAMYVTARGNAIAYAFGIDPVQGSGLGHILQADETQKIEGIEFISKFRAIAETSGQTPDLTITMQY